MCFPKRCLAMSSRIDQIDIFRMISEIQKKLDDPGIRDLIDKGNAQETLSDALGRILTLLEDLSADIAPNGRKSVRDNDGITGPAGDPPDFRTPMLAHINRDLHYLFVDQSYADWLGLGCSEIVGRHISEVLPKDCYQASLPHIQRALLGEEVIYSITIPAGDRLIYLDISLIPQIDSSGSVSAFCTAIRDVTKERLAEKELHRSRIELEQKAATWTEELKVACEALEKSRDYLELIINSISDPIFVMDRKHRLVLVNAAICRLMGLSKEDLLGKTAHDLSFSREIADSYWQRNEEVFTNFREGVVEETHDHFPSAPARVLIKRIPINDSEGNRLLVGIIRDITDIKKAQERIRFQVDLLEQVHNTVIAVDLEGNITYWNKFAETLLGWKAWEVLGKNIAETVVPEWGLERMKRVITELTKDCSSCEGEFSFKTKDGSTLPFHQCFSRINNERGELVGLVGVAVDLTERKQAEEALIRAKMVAEDATSAKSDFLANMSHEIRTPLNAIIGMTSLLFEESLTNEQRDYIEVISTNGEALLTVINDILDYSKIESNRTILEENQFDLRQCVEESLDLVGINAARKGVNLACTIDKNVPERIMGDAGKLKQVLGNLLSNAVKFTDNGEVVVSVSSKVKEEACEIHFTVKDTGIGICEDHMKLLFQPFRQMEPSTSRLYGGTGRGLAISRKLVEMMKGKIWAESVEGKGSRFHFTIKALPGTQEPDPLSSSPQMMDKKVLIVQDNKTNRRILAKQIYDWGMVPMIASSGQEALQYIRRGDEFDIVILDMDLQDTSCLKLAEEIKRCKRRLPILLLVSLGKQVPSGYSYLTKPLKPAQLNRALNDIFR